MSASGRPSKPSGPAGSSSTPTGLLLAPGAGADRNQSALLAVDQAVTQQGLEVVRMDFPYRKEGRRAPDRAPKLVASVVSEAAQMSARGLRLVLGGRSMGGRMCSMAVADGLEAAGLVLISYPLHPPGKAESMRTEHFPRLRVPCLFISGTRDAFGAPGEMEDATAAIPGAVSHHWLEGKDHGLRGCDAAVAELVAAWISGLG